MKDKLCSCIKDKNTDCIPVWFMRQAGRYLPEFREIRKKNPDFINLCLNTKLIKDITLQPLNRFDLDAAIIFSDILMVPYGLGQKVEFKKGVGPILDINFNNLVNTTKEDFIKRLSPVYEGIKKVKNNLKEKTLIGFVSAPWTLLVYMLNKRSPKNNFDFNKLVDQERNKNRLYFIPEGMPPSKEWKETSMDNHKLKKIKKKTLHEISPLKDKNNKELRPGTNISVGGEIEYNELVEILLNKIEDKIYVHVEKQIEAGADIIQIFDSWAGLLPQNELIDYCYAPTSRIVKFIQSKNIPTICFPRGIGKNYSVFCEIVKPDCISIDYDLDPKWCKKNLKGIPIQGGLDPKTLLRDKKKIKKSVEKYLNIFKDYPYVFNLGHGVLPETKPETIEYIIQIVRNKN